MREHTENKSENESKKQAPASGRERERPGFDAETEEPQICRGMD